MSRNPQKARQKRERRRLRIRLSDRTVTFTGRKAERIEGVLEAQRAEFFKKFDRMPGPEDPVFFDPDTDTPQFITPERANELGIPDDERLAGTDNRDSADSKNEGKGE